MASSSASPGREFMSMPDRVGGTAATGRRGAAWGLGSRLAATVRPNGRLAPGVQGLRVVGSQRHRRPLPAGVLRDDALLINDELRLERPAREPIGELVLAGIGLGGLLHREGREVQ